MKIFFDLDGTLIDAGDRLFRLFGALVPSSSLSKEEYWNLKRNKIGHRQILSELLFSDEKIKAFEERWLSMIELPEWLEYDKPFDGVTPFLADLKKKHSLYLITARQFENTALSQVAKFGWANFFSDVMVTSLKTPKDEFVRNKIRTSPADWFVGDTGKDILSGKKLGLVTAAVSCGFLNEEILREYKPDVIAKSVVDLEFIK